MTKMPFIGPALPGNSRISAEPTAGFILAHLKDPSSSVLSYLVAAKPEKLDSFGRRRVSPFDRVAVLV